MSDPKPKGVGQRFDRFAEKYRLWMVLCLVICAGFAVVYGAPTGAALLAVFGALWGVGAAVGALVRLIEKALPQPFSADQRQAVTEAGGMTLFVGGLTGIGMILGGETWLAQTIRAHLPDNFTFSTFPPWFAVVVIVGVWVHTWMCCRS